MSTSTFIIFLSRFYFLTPMDYSLWSKGKFLPFSRQTRKGQNLWNQRSHVHQNWFPCISHQALLAWTFWADFCRFEDKKERGKISGTKEVMQPNLVSMHFTSTSTCMDFLSSFYFLTPMDYSQGNFGHFEDKQEKDKISGTKKVTPTKFGFHAFHVNLYLHELFEQILFFDPMDYSPWSASVFQD